jgi:hypothetical protein
MAFLDGKSSLVIRHFCCFPVVHSKSFSSPVPNSSVFSQPDTIHQQLDWTVSLRQAESVAERFGWTNPCRSLDLWHIAAALDIQAGAFVTFDKPQCALAKAAGPAATNPA